MRRMQMSLLSVVALILLVVPGIAEAGIRFNATLFTPDMHISIGNKPSGQYRSYRTGHLQIRRHRHYKVGRRDREIARRLAWYTGVPLRDVIRLKRLGYQWFEIGRWLRVRRPVIRAAMNQRSWNRFLYGDRRPGRRRIAMR